MGGVGQRVLLGEGLPAAVVALVGDVTLTQLRLQLPQVKPCLVVLRNASEERGDEVTAAGALDHDKWAFIVLSIISIRVYARKNLNDLLLRHMLHPNKGCCDMAHMIKATGQHK